MVAAFFAQVLEASLQFSKEKLRKNFLGIDKKNHFRKAFEGPSLGDYQNLA